jgi:hypothetical protein
MTFDAKQVVADLTKLVEEFEAEVGGGISEYFESHQIDPVRLGALSRLTAKGIEREDIPAELHKPTLWTLGFAFGLFCAERIESLRGE